MSRKAHGQIRRGQVITTYGPGALIDLPEALGDRRRPRHLAEDERPGGDRRAPAHAQAPDHDGRRRAEALRAASRFERSARADEGHRRLALSRVVRRAGGRAAARSASDPAGWSIARRSTTRAGSTAGRSSPRASCAPARRGTSTTSTGAASCTAPRTTAERQLWLDERGTSGDLADLVVRCECEKSRGLYEATVIELNPLGTCRGARPWLGRNTNEDCKLPSRLLIRTASNAYFPQVVSVLSLPDRGTAVRDGRRGTLGRPADRRRRRATSRS